MINDSYDIYVTAEAIWPDSSFKDGGSFENNGTKPDDVRDMVKRLSRQAVAQALDTKAKTQPGKIRIWNSVTAKYADGRIAIRRSWLEGNKSSEDALKASEVWAAKAMKELVEIGSDET